MKEGEVLTAAAARWWYGNARDSQEAMFVQSTGLVDVLA